MGVDDPLARLALDVLRGSSVPLSGEDVARMTGLTPLGTRVALRGLRATPGVCEKDGGWAYVGVSGDDATAPPPD
jgi:hypothetical protein